MSFVITRINKRYKVLQDDDLLEKHRQKKTEKHKFRFRMYDGDREFVYEGFCSSNFSFEPLDCFGRSAACTEIRYWDKKSYQVV